MTRNDGYWRLQLSYGGLNFDDFRFNSNESQNGSPNYIL